ncbi:McrBC 5-methylcytosine restriction system component [Nocardioides salsibiostraticola]
MSPPTEVSLAEYESSDPLDLDEAHLALLTSLPPGQIEVRSAGAAGSYRLRATSYVGTIVLPGLTVRVRPKVKDLRTVLMMFTASAGLVDWGLDDVGYAGADLVDGIAELVLRSSDAATRRGLVHGYRETEERLPVLRGRLRVQEIAARPWEAWPVPCRFDDFTADVPENRVMLAAVRTIGRWAADPAIRRSVSQLLMRFGEVGDSAVPLLECDLIQESPLNDHYGPALKLCRLVLEGLGLTHAAGGLEGRSFLVNMNDLYERWVGAELTRRLWPDLEVEEQDRTALSTKGTVLMKPDLVFRRDGQIVFVADLKYKLTASGIGKGSDYYQLLAYATVLRLNRGLLIYCQSEETPDRQITVAGGGQHLHTHSLPLAGAWTAVEAGLDELATSIRHLASLSGYGADHG